MDEIERLIRQVKRRSPRQVKNRWGFKRNKMNILNDDKNRFKGKGGRVGGRNFFQNNMIMLVTTLGGFMIFGFLILLRRLRAT